MNHSPSPWQLKELSPWIENQNNIWLGSLLTLSRNINNYKFPGKLSKKEQLFKLLSKEILKLDVLKEPLIFYGDKMKPMEKEFLMEHFLSLQPFSHAQSGEGFIVDKSGKFLATINLQDHLTLWKIDNSEEIETHWNQLMQMEVGLAKHLNFSFSSRFGFLTADPSRSGTGLVAYLFLHLPGLIFLDRLNEIINKFNVEEIVHTGFQGAPNETVGDIIVFRNNYTLGITEENIITSLRNLVTKIISSEKSSRKELKESNNALLKDKISRAYAILMHSYQIDAIEALNAISLLKLGLDLGWLTNTTHAQVNTLLFTCRRAHLLSLYNETITPEEIPHQRAAFVHKTLQGAELNL